MPSPAAADPEILTFEATVESVDGSSVVLDESYFYPEGGGQPADRGTLGGGDVIDVQSRDGRIVHVLATDPAFAAGDVVSGSVDAAFRTYCTRAHTASHVLYGAGRRVLDDLGYGGFDIGEEKIRVDFSTTTAVDDDRLVELERLANRAVWDSYEVTWETVPAESALAREDVAFNETTEEGIAGDAVRVVTVGDWDVAACGGTHVRNTRDIGPIAVLDRSNPGQGLTRVEFAVGPPAIERRAAERRSAMRAARTLETGVGGLPDVVVRLLEERDDRRAELASLRERLVDARLAELREETVRKDGQTWLVGSLSGVDANGLAERAQAAVGAGESSTVDAPADGGDAPDVVALVSEDGRYVAVATDGSVDAESVVDTVTDAFGGGGGGGPTRAQGGGLDADAETVVALLRG